MAPLSTHGQGQPFTPPCSNPQGSPGSPSTAFSQLPNHWGALAQCSALRPCQQRLRTRPCGLGPRDALRSTTNQNLLCTGCRDTVLLECASPAPNPTQPSEIRHAHKHGGCSSNLSAATCPPPPPRPDAAAACLRPAPATPSKAAAARRAKATASPAATTAKTATPSIPPAKAAAATTKAAAPAAEASAAPAAVPAASAPACRANRRLHTRAAH